MSTANVKAWKGVGMEGFIARSYEKTTRKGLDEFRRDAGRLAALRPQGGDVLEVAPGPGFLAVELGRDPRFRVTGLDASRTFVDLARENARAANVPASFYLGDAAAMPFGANSFDLLICRAAFKNFSRPVEALREMHRVLRPGGQGLIIDLRRDATVPEIRAQMREWNMGGLGGWMNLQIFRFMLLKRAYSGAEVEGMLRAIPFAAVQLDYPNICLEVSLRK